MQTASASGWLARFASFLRVLFRYRHTLSRLFLCLRIGLRLLVCLLLVVIALLLLHFQQLRVPTIRSLAQFVMLALFHDLVIIQHDDFIAILNGSLLRRCSAQSVSSDPFRIFFILSSFYIVGFRFNVQRRSRLITQYNGPVWSQNSLAMFTRWAFPWQFEFPSPTVVS
jgi:hypothetical protein